MKRRKAEKVWLFILLFSLLAIPQASFASNGASKFQDEPLGDTGVSSHTITQPDGTGDTLPEGDDFATTVLSNPWDMSTITDIYNERTQDINSAAGTKRMTIESGLLAGTSSTTDPRFWLLYPGYENVGIDSPGKYGVNTPIDAAKYTRLTFRMYLSAVAPSDRGTVNWYRDSWLNEAGHDWGQSNFFALEPGWHIYSLDLSTIGRQAGTINWGGSIQGLRVDPTSATGVDIKIDWARLTPNTTVQSSSTDITNYQIQFTGTGSAALYSDTDTNPDNGFYSVIDKNVDLSTGSYSWETIGMPGADYHIAAQSGSDFASLVLGNAWDMKEAADVAFTSPAVSGPTFNSGIFSYSVAASGDAYFWLRNANEKTIDTSKFTRLTFRMNSSVASPTNEGWYLNWWDSNEDPHGLTGGLRPVQAGWQIYTIDLSTQAAWTGDVRRIHLKPFASGTTGANIQIDWVSVTTGSTPADEAALAVETVYGSGPITVKKAPLLRITKPSKTSGDDYANLSFGDPWDMDKASDIDSTDHLEGSPTFTSGILNATTDGVQTSDSPPTGDPSITLRTGGLNTTKPINADRYKYVTWYYKEDGSAAQSGGLQDTVLGWVSRLLWWNKGAGIDAVTTKDFVINEGWNLYQLDLSTTQTEHGGAGTDWSGTQTVFRFDPNEIVDKTNVHLSCIALTAPEEADASFTIRWVDFYNDTATVDPCYRGSVLETSVVAAQAEATLATDLVDIYYDTDKDPATKTLIASDVSATARQYVWDSSTVAPGTYYIYLVAKDGFNSVGRYSEIPVTIRRAASIALTSPGATNPTVPLGTDYPLTVLGNSWDMSAANDVIFQAGISSPSFNGEFSGTAADGNPYFWLNVDQAKPIVASQYTKLVFRMYASAETQGAVFWSPAEGTWHSSTPHTVLAGWNDYTIDLSAYANWTGTMGWLRIDPVRTAGVQFKFDWVKLVVPNSSSHTVTWTSTNPGSTKMALYYDENDNGLDGNLIASGINTSANSYKWDTSAMEAGIYYIYGVVGEGSSAASGYSPGTLTVGVPLVLNEKVYLPWVARSN